MAEVLAVDQEKINRFGNLNTQCIALKLELGKLEKKKEGYEEVATDLELVQLENDVEVAPYQVGTAFIELPIDTAVEEAQKDGEDMDQKIEEIKSKIAEKKAEMSLLRGALYAKFGRENINLGNDDDE